MGCCRPVAIWSEFFSFSDRLIANSKDFDVEFKGGMPRGASGAAMGD